MINKQKIDRLTRHSLRFSLAVLRRTSIDDVSSVVIDIYAFFSKYSNRQSIRFRCMRNEWTRSIRIQQQQQLSLSARRRKKTDDDRIFLAFSVVLAQFQSRKKRTREGKKRIDRSSTTATIVFVCVCDYSVCRIERWMRVRGRRREKKTSSSYVKENCYLLSSMINVYRRQTSYLCSL